MPTYPNYPQTSDTKVQLQRALVADEATNGRFRARVLGSVKARITAVHMLTRADLAALDAFYAANATAELDFVLRESGAAYTVVFSDVPQRELAAARMYRVTVSLAEV